VSLLSLKILVIAGCLFMLGAPAFAANPPGGDLLPDLVAMPPRDLSIEVAGTEKRLRFSLESANVDTGPLEIAPQGPQSDCDHDGNPNNDRTVYQIIYRDLNNDGVFTRGVDVLTRSVFAGCMVFHVAHNHWHFVDFSGFELKNTGGATLLQGTKISFCLADTARSSPNVPGSPGRSYYGNCDQAAPQGISAGWSDIYDSSLPEQYLIINGVPDGDYCLVSTVDPMKRILETNESNNTASTRFRLVGNTVTLLGNTPCTGGGGGPLFVYDDALNWNNWSWNTTVNPNATSPVFSGNRSMAVTYGAWSGLSLQTPGFSTAPYTRLHFAIAPGAVPLSGINVSLFNSNDTELPGTNAQSYASPAGGGWFSVDIPLSALSGANTTISRVTLQENRGSAQPTIYVDELAFASSAGPPPPPPSPYTIYGDSLQWDNWSFDTTVDPAATSPVYAGTRSMSVTFNAAWAGLNLRTAGFNTAGYTSLRFAIRPGGQPLSAMSVTLNNADSGGALGSANPASYAVAASGGWYLVTIPLSALGAANTTITRVMIQDLTGAPQPVFYLDEIGFN
jgi:hypothetical protein